MNIFLRHSEPRAPDRPAFTPRSTTNAKSRVPLERRQLQCRLGARRFAFGSGMRSSDYSNAISGPEASARRARGVMQALRRQLHSQRHVLRPDVWHRAPESPGCSQFRGPPGTTAHGFAGGAPACNHPASASAFTSTRRPRRCPALPPAPFGLASARRTPDRGGELILRLVALEHLPDLEQRHVGESAIRILLRGCDQPRNKALPHVGEFCGDRLASASSACPPPNSSACSLRGTTTDGRPWRDPLSARFARGAHLQDGEDRLARVVAPRKRRVAAPCRRRRCARSPRRCRPCRRESGRHDGIATFTVLALAGDEEHGFRAHASFRRAARRGGQALHLGDRKFDDAVVRMR